MSEPFLDAPDSTTLPSHDAVELNPATLPHHDAVAVASPTPAAAAPAPPTVLELVGDTLWTWAEFIGETAVDLMGLNESKYEYVIDALREEQRLEAEESLDGQRAEFAEDGGVRVTHSDNV